MGRVVKRFKAISGERKVSGLAIVDTGADRSLLSNRAAKRLGVAPGITPVGASFGVGDQPYLHWKYHVDLTVGEYSVDNLLVATPFAVVLGKKKTGEPITRRIRQSENLIGHDFLQEAKVPLNYRRPHDKIFGGKRRRLVFGIWREGTMTPELLKLAREVEAKYFAGKKGWATTKTKRPRTKRAGGKKRG